MQSAFLRGGARKSGRLDVEADRSKTRKSKTQVGAPERKTRHNICAKNYIKSHKPLALKLTSSRIIQVSNNLHFYERRGVIIMKFMDKDDFEKQNVFEQVRQIQHMLSILLVILF